MEWQGANQDTVGAGFDNLSGFENLRGSAHGDALSGDDGNNMLEGGASGDALVGGDGDDTASYLHATAGVTANLAAPGGNTGEAIDDTYFSIENLLGSMFNDILIGDDNDNVLDG